MKTYPSIPKEIRPVPVYAFDKLDGSNIRVEWSKKHGFHKFGTRTRLLGPDEETLGKAYTLINDFIELEQVFAKNKWQDVTLFFELCGPNSFAGWHDISDNHVLSLFDVSVYKKGFIPPNDFSKLFGDFRIAKLLYTGNANQPFAETVRNGTLEGMTFEGVVCKYVERNQIKMFKIKNRAWVNKLRHKCGDNDALFNQLS